MIPCCFLPMTGENPPFLMGDHAAQATYEYLLRLLVFHETFHRGHAGAAEVAQAAAQGSAGHKQAEIYGRYIYIYL